MFVIGIIILAFIAFMMFVACPMIVAMLVRNDTDCDKTLWELYIDIIRKVYFN